MNTVQQFPGRAAQAKSNNYAAKDNLRVRAPGIQPGRSDGDTVQYNPARLEGTHATRISLVPTQEDLDPVAQGKVSIL